MMLLLLRWRVVVVWGEREDTGKQKQTIKDKMERVKEYKKRDGVKGNAHMKRKKKIIIKR